MMRMAIRLRGEDRGATAVEYGLILCLIAVAASGAIALFADGTVDMWEFVKTNALDNL